MKQLLLYLGLVILLLAPGCSDDSRSDPTRLDFDASMLRVEVEADGPGPVDYHGTFESGALFEELEGTTPATHYLERDGRGADFRLSLSSPDGICVSVYYDGVLSHRGCGVRSVLG